MGGTAWTEGPRMPFGKHKGELLGAVPSDYLVWLLRNCALRAWLQAEIEAEMQRRQGCPAAPPPAAATSDVEQLVRRWYRELAKKYHPDRGGTNEAMKVVNDA